MSLPEITALCRVLARSDASDQRQQSQNLDRLQELQGYLAPHAAPGITACLEACSFLVARLSEGSQLSHQDVLTTVCKVMSSVEKHWAGVDPDVAIASSLYEGESEESEAAPTEEQKIDSQVHGAKTAVFQVGDIEEAQARIEKLKRTPRINEMVLGELLVELGHVSNDEVTSALEEQAQTGELLGEVLIARGSITRQMVAETVELQVRLRAESTAQSIAEPPKPAPAPKPPSLSLAADDVKGLRNPDDDNTLGAILIRQGAIKESELERALVMQRAAGLRLGEALVDMHATTWETINRAIELQRRLRTAAGLPGTKRIAF